MPYLSNSRRCTAFLPRLPFQVLHQNKRPQIQHFQPLYFCIGWPSSSLMFESRISPLCEYHDFHCIRIDPLDSDTATRQATGLLKASTTTPSPRRRFRRRVPQPREPCLPKREHGLQEGLPACPFSNIVDEKCKEYIWTSLPLPSRRS